MNKKKFFLLAFLVLISYYGIKAQTSDVFIYNEGGNTTFYHKVNNHYMVICSNTTEANALIAYFPRKKIVTPCRIIVLTTQDSLAEYVASSNANIKYSNIILSADSSVAHWCENRVFVKVKPNISILDLLIENDISYSNYMQFGSDNDVYLVALSTQNDMSIEYANLLFITGNVVFSQPDFGILQAPLSLSNPFYGNQWGLNNTGQYGGIAGIDINAPQAWVYSDGTGTNVAVLDDGIDVFHNDLSENLLPGYDATDNALGGGLFGECKFDDPHGTACAGIIAAADNNIGIKGIAYKSNIIPIRMAYNIVDTFYGGLRWFSYCSWIANAIYKSWHDYGADVLSCSWGGSDSLDIIRTEIINAKNNGRNGKGCPIVFAAGNHYQNSFGSQLVRNIFPANLNEAVIAVGAASPCGERKNFISCDSESYWMSCWGPKLSVLAPGVKIFTTDLTGLNGYNSLYQTDSNYYDNDYFATYSGTSAAAPHVAGIAALILSANPTLTVKQVRDIIEKTAQKVRDDLYTYNPPNTDYPNGTWNYNTGYGMVDAYNAVKAAIGYNLYIRDTIYDNGAEQSGVSTFDSPDIWIRRTLDGGTDHQLVCNGKNYLYVRLHNNGSAPSITTDSLRIYGRCTSLQAGSTWGTSASEWQQYGICAIPEIPAGGTVVLTFPVNININTGLFQNYSNFAFYARIESSFDSLFTPETSIMRNNVFNNNNIAAKNVLVTNHYLTANNYGLDANIAVSVVSINAPTSNLRINFAPEGEAHILDDAEITLIFSEDLMDEWTPVSDNLKQISANTYLVTGETVVLSDIPETDITMRYNFLTRHNEHNNIYKNHITQYIGSGDDMEFIGGLTIQVEKPERPTTNRFRANAGNDTTVMINTTATLHATQISENATYRWYDKQRNFKYEGLNYTVATSKTSEYILEITAEKDGYRDLDTVKVTVSPGYISSITPNPATGNWITVSYEYTTTVTSAQIFIYNTGTNTLVGNYNISNFGNVSSLDINITTFPTGTYNVILVCDNAVSHSKVLIIQ